MRFILRLLLLLLVPLALAMQPAPATAKQIQVTVTQDQVNNVCGKKLQSSGEYSGCSVICYGGQVCDFECKGSKCYGQVLLTKNPSDGKQVVGLGLAARLQVAQLCGLHRIPTANDPFGCSEPCDLQICDYNCTSPDLCTVVAYVQVKLTAPDPQNLAHTSSSPGGAAPAGVPVLY